jgi:hypothetical protein
MIIGVMIEITPDKHLSHPLPPEKGKTLGGIPIENPDGYGHGKGGQIDPKIFVEPDRVALSKRVDEVPAHITDQDLGGSDQKA